MTASPKEFAWFEQHEDDPRAHACAAVDNGDLARLDAVLTAHGKTAVGTLPGPVQGNDTSPLIRAAIAGDSASAERLLKAGADPNDDTGEHSHSALGWAVVANSLSCVRLLLDHGATPRDDEDLPDIAVRYAPDFTTNRLLDFLARSFPASSETLAAAIKRHKPEWAETLLEAGADPNEYSMRAGGRAMLAALKAPGDDRPDSVGPRLVSALVRHGARLDEPIGPGETNNPVPLDAAVELGAYWAIDLLIEHGADIDVALTSMSRRSGCTRLQDHHDGQGTVRAAAALFKAVAKSRAGRQLETTGPATA